jgi:hypothetical protein
MSTFTSGTGPLSIFLNPPSRFRIGRQELQDSGNVGSVPGHAHDVVVLVRAATWTQNVVGISPIEFHVTV